MIVSPFIYLKSGDAICTHNQKTIRLLSLRIFGHNKKPVRKPYGFGGSGWIRTTEAKRNRFTVCPLWPLGNSSIFHFGAGGRTRTPDLLITNQLLYQLSYTSLFVLFQCQSTCYIISYSKPLVKSFLKLFYFFLSCFFQFCCAVTTDNILAHNSVCVNPFPTIFLIFLHIFFTMTVKPLCNAQSGCRLSINLHNF